MIAVVMCGFYFIVKNIAAYWSIPDFVRILCSLVFV